MNRPLNPIYLKVTVTEFHGSVILPYILTLNWFMTNFFYTLFGYDKPFDPKVVIGHYDLISRFSDFPLYLGTQLVYEHTSSMICLHMTRPLTVKYSWATVT